VICVSKLEDFASSLQHLLIVSVCGAVPLFRCAAAVARCPARGYRPGPRGRGRGGARAGRAQTSRGRSRNRVLPAAAVPADVAGDDVDVGGVGDVGDGVIDMDPQTAEEVDAVLAEVELWDIPGDGADADLDAEWEVFDDHKVSGFSFQSSQGLT
jgi:hypothetical protein